jgi:predicted anti-sigma-YlaC factor YlaD
VSTKALFVPLKTRYFRAFESGVKTIEYRRAGARWNECSCWIGRPVTLSHGYSGARLYARVASVQRIFASELADPDPYLPTDELIAIALEGIAPAER